MTIVSKGYGLQEASTIALSTSIYTHVCVILFVFFVSPISDCDIILANTYHCAIQPTTELLEEMGGLHSFMAWPHNLLTDSGGFQMVCTLSHKPPSHVSAISVLLFLYFWANVYTVGVIAKAC